MYEQRIIEIEENPLQDDATSADYIMEDIHKPWKYIEWIVIRITKPELPSEVLRDQIKYIQIELEG